MAMASNSGPSSPFESTTFEKDVSIFVNDTIGAASISPSGRDVVLAGKNGLLIIDLDSPYSPPRQIVNRTEWEVADVQWSPFACRSDWIASTCNQKALIYNLSMETCPSKAPIQHVLHAHDRAITDINFSAHHADLLATCAVDSYVFTWDLRDNSRPVMKFADFDAGATQVKWNRQDEHVIASAHDRLLRIWDTRFGAIPVTTINAHSTKIYGIDWDRSDSRRILTCSLDHTIKLWDWSKYANKTDHPSLNLRDRYKYVVQSPEKTIKTPFPVWRARHTPFAHGILALPQRGSSALHLYDHVREDSHAVHQFHAHEETARVKEFLWRVRGSVEDNIDNREFQLVSWGSDLHLHLHRIKPETLYNAIGYQKGQPVVGKPSRTRLGAAYVTYRDEPVRGKRAERKSRPSDAPMGNLTSLLQKAALNGSKASLQAGDQDRVTMTARQGRNTTRKVVNHIKWMEGVKIGERVTDSSGKLLPNLRDGAGTYPWNDRDDLASEVRAVGSKYKKVDFEKVNHTTRKITVSLNRPCGPDEKLAFLRITIHFPVGYPKASYTGNEHGDMEKTFTPPIFELQKTTAAISQETLDDLRSDLQTLVNHYARQERQSLEAMVRLLLGERLETSMTLDPHDEDVPGLIAAADEEDSDDDDDEDDDEAENHGAKTGTLAAINAGANVPYPKECSATFSASGMLALTRIPYQEPSSRFVNPSSRGLGIFETFGRLRTKSPIREKQSAADDEWSDDEDNGSFVSSSTSSSTASSSEFDNGGPRGKFQPPLAWQKTNLRFQSKASHPSSISARPVKPKSVISTLRSVAEFIPSKRSLAEEYDIFGDGPSVCDHNAEVARKHGYEDLANVWELSKLILSNEVPLDILPQQHRREQVLVLARRALVRIKRKDSGLDLQFDEADNVTNPKLKGRVKWGHHPIATWLIPQLFEHFEKLADTQMLAMLSCIFSEPAAHEGFSSNTVSKRRNMPMSMEAPAFSLDYFPSAEAAWSLFKPTISIPTTPAAHSRYATPIGEFGWSSKFMRGLDVYGSHGSSNGPWGSDAMPSEPVTPYSTGNTPPTLSRAPTFRSIISHTPFGTSPEQHQTLKKTNTSNFASAFATLSRPFANVSSSPPVKARTEGDLSTSAPTSGVTWGINTFYSSGSTAGHTTPNRNKHGKRASFGQTERVNIDYISDSDDDDYSDDEFLDRASEYTIQAEEKDGDREGTIKVTLKNQDKFDDEACLSAPLLDMKKEWLYRRWREQYAEMLGIWGLITKRAEILKFNGLISYFPVDDKSTAPPQLGLKAADTETPPHTPSIQLSRSSILVPPTSIQFQYQRGTQGNSPRHFSFNPEAREFKPGSYLNTSAPETPFAPATDSYLSLSAVPSVEPEPVLPTPLERSKLKPRPSISRAHSRDIVGRRRQEEDYMNNSNIAQRKRKPQDIHFCSICWIRITGRFYLCAACGHVAHFDCVQLPSSSVSASQFKAHGGLGIEMDECVVGCACACGEDEEDQNWPETPWGERGGWLDGGFVNEGRGIGSLAGTETATRKGSAVGVSWYEPGYNVDVHKDRNAKDNVGRRGSGRGFEGFDVNVWSPGAKRKGSGKGKRRS
ncbi:hypothetical protein GQ43DRAFT_473907 [Delitschia confertaspora ATCC 74209]|uniref:WD domain, G-beta repeat protein n=1 Tax=Delitschia confertaspora ATCC 74209 TaxID=1513339 RepID=A0A9P4JHC4_9PLEO|nr:hypothetical protein GQ43DRAFT_473907 [Delitschia confertaspora ATCC 74209]